MKLQFNGLQQLGRALMLPIAVLPIAGLLLRIGQPDLLDWPATAAAGKTIFDHLGLLFAVGVGVGLARENHGAAGLAALVGYIVTAAAAATMLKTTPDALAKLSIPMGLLSGLIAGGSYNRFGNISLPSYLSFFGGRRFVPIVCGLAGLALGALLGLTWPYVESGMDAASRSVLGAGSLGLFAYGTLNRALIVTGLHHILNNFAWFIIGDYHGATGDLNRFFAGDPEAGAFMSGFFPVMMFGLPGACLAMYRSARPERRKGVGGLLLSLALTSFLTGVTEPIEFTFMFLAPVLYVLHAIATGLAMVIMHLLGVHLGFSFSAGLFDYILNFNRAQRPWLLIPVGLLYFGLYYGVFRVCITRLNLATPGRETEDLPVIVAPTSGSELAQAFIVALGGAANLTEVAACTTRLRLLLKNNTSIDEPRLKALGARGVLRTSELGLQVVLGPIADQVAGEMRDALKSSVATAQEGPALLKALGGRGNVRSFEVLAGRLVFSLEDPAHLDGASLEALNVRGVTRSGERGVQVLVEDPAVWLKELSPLTIPAA